MVSRIYKAQSDHSASQLRWRKICEDYASLEYKPTLAAHLFHLCLGSIERVVDFERVWTKEIDRLGASVAWPFYYLKLHFLSYSLPFCSICSILYFVLYRQEISLDSDLPILLLPFVHYPVFSLVRHVLVYYISTSTCLQFSLLLRRGDA